MPYFTEIFLGLLLCSCFRINVVRSKLQWSALSVQYESRIVLNVTEGCAYDGRLLGILGPSGCGKSTLLRSLSSRFNPVNGLVLYFDKANPDASSQGIHLQKHEVAFVHQDDSFFPMLTVAETMEFAARLRSISDSRTLTNSISHRCNNGNKVPNIEDVVSRIMSSLSLTHVADSTVGSKSSGATSGADSSARGISGGERKRLAVGSQMTGSPKMVIADEPTSGLDSFNSQKMVQLLHDVAVQEQMIAICTIHQPRSSIWNLFDDVMILTPFGNTAYHGPRVKAVEYFSKLGFECPVATNPAEFLIDLVSIDSTSSESKEKSETRIQMLTAAFIANKARTKSGKLEIKHSVSSRSVAMLRRRSQQLELQQRSAVSNVLTTARNSAHRVFLLFQRSVRQILRDYATNVVRLGTSGVLAIVVGSVYGMQGAAIQESSVAARVNIIAQAVINVAMLSMIKTLQLFKKERAVVDRERAQEQYTAAEYLVAKSTAELPFDAAVAAFFGFVLHTRTGLYCSRNRFMGLLALLGMTSSSLGLAVGALAPSGDVALAVGPALMVVYLIMGSIGPSGSNDATLPSVLKPFRWLSPMKWGCEALCSAEFKGQQLVMGRRSRSMNMIGAKSVKEIGRLLSSGARALSAPQSQQQSLSGGDRVLGELGVPDASYEAASQTLWCMLAGHLLCALIGLINSRPNE